MVMRRNKREIYIDTLKAIQTEASPTRIMGVANLSWKPFWSQIRPKLIEEGLIIEQPADNPNDKKQKYFYRLTKKGQMAIAAQNDADRYLPAEEGS
jgi:predicted transcriptional regulator